MAIDKLNSLQFLFLRADYFQEFGDSDCCGGHGRRLPAISIFFSTRAETLSRGLAGRRLCGGSAVRWIDS